MAFMSMLSLAPRLPMYWSFRRLGRPRLYPFSIVVSVSFRCNSKCRTCDVWRKPNDDMTVEEWDRVFAGLGRTPFYITFTGGEPFLRKDLDEMVISAYRHCRPSVITIPTNGNRSTCHTHTKRPFRVKTATQGHQCQHYPNQNMLYSLAIHEPTP